MRRVPSGGNWSALPLGWTPIISSRRPSTRWRRRRQRVIGPHRIAVGDELGVRQHRARLLVLGSSSLATAAESAEADGGVEFSAVLAQIDHEFLRIAEHAGLLLDRVGSSSFSRQFEIESPRRETAAVGGGGAGGLCISSVGGSSSPAGSRSAAMDRRDNGGRVGSGWRRKRRAKSVVTSTPWQRQRFEAGGLHLAVVRFDLDIEERGSLPLPSM